MPRFSVKMAVGEIHPSQYGILVVYRYLIAIISATVASLILSDRRFVGHKLLRQWDLAEALLQHWIAVGAQPICTHGRVNLNDRQAAVLNRCKDFQTNAIAVR